MPPNAAQAQANFLRHGPSIARTERLYMQCLFGDYEHKRARNKRIGPGGGTRRLHQTSFIGGSWGRNRIDGRLKGLALFR